MPNSHQREVAVFEAALQLPPEQREAYLDRTCGDDPELRDRIRGLLRAHQDQTDLLEPPVRAPGSAFDRDVLPAEKPGDQIGPYKLLQQIGEGGCGVVYMAEQAKPIQRRVALKIIKLGMDTKQVVARFDAERHALALMDHPNIARVLDAGATATGRPYFVMELVRGIKITDYCDQNHLTTRDRLNLFIQVCHAVQHAHQKGIIHRDLKPSNILVTVNDGTAVPKVIDFGIAKATQGRLTDQTVFTAFEQFIGTPAYMSPEQVAMTSVDIDTRSDIYSLGVLLYELLTGRTPFDTKELLAAGLDQMRRTICETQPARPSTRLSTLGEGELTTTAQWRKVQPPELVHLVRDDLDWIVMKCLEKDRARRYETANGLAMDIQRHLNCEPVVARPPSRLYEFQKTVRRHKVGFAATAAVILALALGLGISIWSLVKERQDRRRADHEAATANRITEFMQQMLNTANPHSSKTPDYTVREMLDDFAGAIDVQFANDPEVVAELRTTVGTAYYNLQEDDKAKRQLARALELRAAVYGTNSGNYADSLTDYGLALHSSAAELEEGELYLRRALAIYHARGIRGYRVIHALWVLQVILDRERKYKEIEALVTEAQAEARQSPGTNYFELAAINNGLITAEINEGKYSEAERIARETIASETRLLGPDYIETAWAYAGLSQALLAQSKYAEALAAAKQDVAIMRKRISPDQVRYGEQLQQVLNTVTAASSARALTSLFSSAGQLEKLESLFQERLGTRPLLPDDDSDPANVAMRADSQFPSLYLELADEMSAAGQTNEAVECRLRAAECRRTVAALLDQQIAELKRNIGDKTGDPVEQGLRLGGLLGSQQKWSEARDIYSEVIRQKPDSVEAWAARGDCFLQIGDFSDMAKDYSEAIRLKPDRQWYWHERAFAYQSLGEFKKAIADHSKCIEMNDNDAGERWRRGRAYEAVGDFQDAAADYSRAIEIDVHSWQSWDDLARVDFYQHGADKAGADLAEAARRCSTNGTPSDQDSLAWMLTENGDPRLRDGSDAVELAEKAVASTSRTNRSFLSTLAVAYAEVGRFTNAVNVEREALHSETNPEKIKWRTSTLKLFEAKIPYQDPESLNDTAWKFATSPLAKVRDGKMAVALAEEAVSLTSRTNAWFLDTLAAAYAETGDFAKAVAVEKESITLLTDKKQIDDATKRLKLYEANTPYRAP